MVKIWRDEIIYPKLIRIENSHSPLAPFCVEEIKG